MKHNTSDAKPTTLCIRCRSLRNVGGMHVSSHVYTCFHIRVCLDSIPRTKRTYVCQSMQTCFPQWRSVANARQQKVDPYTSCAPYVTDPSWKIISCKARYIELPTADFKFPKEFLIVRPVTLSCQHISNSRYVVVKAHTQCISFLCRLMQRCMLPGVGYSNTDVVENFEEEVHIALSEALPAFLTWQRRGKETGMFPTVPKCFCWD